MRTLKITISDEEYESLGLKSENVSYSDLVDIVSKQLARQNLEKSEKLAGTRKKIGESSSLRFLDDEENLYCIEDLKVLYNSNK